MSGAVALPGLVVIGRGTLALACCQLLAERGLPVYAIVSTDPALRRWGDTEGIPCLSTPAGLLDMAWQDKPILLSIANQQLVPAAVLDLFSRGVNFHDGPLPRYAGSHVTSWALLARERKYAVSWHEMTSTPDAGDVLLQLPVPVAADETALTLNAKCHEAALQSFPQLMDRMISGNWAGTRQNLSQRSFFARDQRPDNVALLDWNRTADELWALVRALSFGPYVNRLGLPKLWLGDSLVGVRSLQVAAARSTAFPGTLVSTAAPSLRVATAGHDVLLKEFQTLDGGALSAEQLVSMARLRERMVLPAFPQAAAKAAAAHACGWKEELLWMDDLRRLKPVDAPMRPAKAHDSAGSSCLVLPGFERRLLPGSVDAVDFALAIVLAWLARSGTPPVFDVGMRCTASDALPKAANMLLARTRPFRADARCGQPFELFREDCRVRLVQWQARKPYLRDAVMRYPGLVRPQGWLDFASWPVSVEMLATGCRHEGAPDSASALTFAIGAPAGEVTLVHDGLAESQLATMAGQLAALAQDALARPWAALGDLSLLPPGEAAALRHEVWGPQLSL